MKTLHECVEGLDADGVQQCLAEGADVNATDLDGDTPLHCIAKWRKVKVSESASGGSAQRIIHALLDAGADTTARTNAGKTAEEVLQAQAIALQEEFSQLPPNVAAPGDRMLRLVTFQGVLNAVRGARSREIIMSSEPVLDLRDRKGRTGLFFAAEEGDTEDVVRRLEAGASPDVADEDGYTPLCVAARQGDRGVFDALVERQDFWWASNSTLLDQSLLHIAAIWDVRGEFVSHIIEKLGEKAKVRQMLDWKDTHGYTPLHRAATGSTHLHAEEAAQVLVGAGADVNVQNKQGRTPLMSAAGRGMLDVSRVLLEGGADVNHKCNQSATPLGAAMRSMDPETISMLHRAGAIAQAWEIREIVDIPPGNIEKDEVAKIVVQMVGKIGRVQERKAVGQAEEGLSPQA